MPAAEVQLLLESFVHDWRQLCALHCTAGGGLPEFRRLIDAVHGAAKALASTLLFETLDCSPAFNSFGGEAHWLMENLEALRPGAPGVDSNRLTAVHATPRGRDPAPNHHQPASGPRRSHAHPGRTAVGKDAQELAPRRTHGRRGRSAAVARRAAKCGLNGMALPHGESPPGVAPRPGRRLALPLDELGADGMVQHRDFVTATRNHALQLRYLVRLYVKELVLKNCAGLPADRLLERMIELSWYAEEKLEAGLWATIGAWR